MNSAIFAVAACALFISGIVHARTPAPTIARTSCSELSQPINAAEAAAYGSCVEVAQAAESTLNPFLDAGYLYAIDLKTDGAQDRFPILPDTFVYLPTKEDRQGLNQRARNMLALLAAKLPLRSGILLRVSALTNGLNPPKLPENFLVPLSAGANPVDAFAEYLNLPVAQVQVPPPGFSDVGYFLWIENLGNSKLRIGVIPRSREPSLLKAGTTLGDLKVELKQSGVNYVRYPMPDYAERSGFWTRRLDEVEAQIKDTQRRAAIQNLVDRFLATQREQTRILQQTANTKRRKSDLDAVIEALETILSVGKGINSTLPELQSFFDKAKLQKESDLRGKDINRTEVIGRALVQTIKGLDKDLQEIPELHS